MGQVPTAPLLLVGSGRLARHIGRYCTLEGVAFETWSRREPRRFSSSAAGRRVILAISDDAIETFTAKHEQVPVQTWIHCSGCVVSERAVGLHPLFTFAPDRFETLDVYRSIVFVSERGRPDLSSVVPELHNRCIAIDSHARPLYHALCVLGGNFTTLLWRTVVAESQRIGLEPESMMPYLDAVVRNLWSSSDPFTGPLARGDQATVQRNREALAETPLAPVYDTFCELFAAVQAAPERSP